MAVSAVTRNSHESLVTDFCGLELDSPIVLLSGCVGFGEEYTRIEGFSNRDVGAVVLKGTTREPRAGNAPHRVYETPAGMLNAIGLQNPGARAVVDDIPGVLEVYRMGGDVDYLVKAVVADMPGYDALYKELIRADLFEVSASFVMEPLKQTTELPL